MIGSDVFTAQRGSEVATQVGSGGTKIDLCWFSRLARQIFQGGRLYKSGSRLICRRQLIVPAKPLTWWPALQVRLAVRSVLLFLS